MNMPENVDRLFQILWCENPAHVVYVYRLGSNGATIRPYLLKRRACPGLLEMLRDDFGGGDFKIMVRNGRTMVFAGEISIIRRQQSPSGFAR